MKESVFQLPTKRSPNSSQCPSKIRGESGGISGAFTDQKVGAVVIAGGATRLTSLSRLRSRLTGADVIDANVVQDDDGATGCAGGVGLTP